MSDKYEFWVLLLLALCEKVWREGVALRLKENSKLSCAEDRTFPCSVHAHVAVNDSSLLPLSALLRGGSLFLSFDSLPHLLSPSYS